MTKQDTITKLTATEASLKRWQTRATRANNMVAKLLKTQRRIMAQFDYGQIIQVAVDKPKPVVKAPEVKVPAPEVIVTVAKAKEEKPVPSFLDRSDPHIAARMTAARKKAEAEERTKMPLTGKAALAKIREKK